MTDRNSGQKSVSSHGGGRSPGGQFAKGNPGKPRGSRHKATQAVQAMIEGEAEQLTRKAIDLALAGDATALRLCIERLAPAPKDAPVPFKAPQMKTAADAATAMASIVAAVAAGDLTPSEAERIAGLIDTWCKALETTELAARVAVLEANVSMEKG
ncbi:MAG: DUF5681 domain-containing protein [Hyphomonadaceae bacterium]